MMKSIFILLGLVDNTLALQFSALKPGGLLAPVTKANLWDVVKTADAATSYIDWKELDQKYQTMLASRGGAKPSPKAFDVMMKDAWEPFLTSPEKHYDPKIDKIDRIKNFRAKANNPQNCGHFCNLSEPDWWKGDTLIRGYDVGQTYLEVIPTQHLPNVPLHSCADHSDCSMKDTHTINGVQVRRGDAGKSAQPWNYTGDFKIEYAKHLQEMVFHSLQYVQRKLDDIYAKVPKELRPKAKIADTDPKNRTNYDRKYLQRSQLQPGLIFPLFHHHVVSRSLTHMHVYVVLDPEDPKFFGKGDPSKVGWHPKTEYDIFTNGMAVEQVFRNIIDGEEGKKHAKSFNMNPKKTLVVASL